LNATNLKKNIKNIIMSLFNQLLGVEISFSYFLKFWLLDGKENEENNNICL